MRKKSLLEIVAENVRRRRLALEWSQEALADSAALHRTYVGAIERAEKNLTLQTMERVAAALGCEVVELLRAEGRR